MRNPIPAVKNFITTHKAPIAFVAGTYVGAIAMRNTSEWKEFLNEDETASTTEA